MPSATGVHKERQANVGANGDAGATEAEGGKIERRPTEHFRNLHLVRRNGCWAIEEQGRDGALTLVRDRDRAEHVATRWARREHRRLIIHGHTGDIARILSYR